MPPKQPKTPPKKWDTEFVSCNLDKAMKAKLKAWELPLEEAFLKVQELVTDGYKLSFSYDSYNDCTGVFLTVKDPQHKNSGLCLSGRGPDFASALKCILFKHFVILGGEWGTEVERRGERDPWG